MDKIFLNDAQNDSVIYSDKNDFNKKLRSLRRYCPIAYKEFVFKTSKVYETNKQDGIYKKPLKTSKEFKQVYGQIYFVFKIENEKMIYHDLYPNEFLIDGYREDLNIYKGMPYRDNKDKFKIDLMMANKGIGKVLVA